MIIGSATVPIPIEPTLAWYEIQYSLRDADDWYTSGFTADTIEAARKSLTEKLSRRQMAPPTSFDYRIVRRTLTTEVVS